MQKQFWFLILCLVMVSVESCKKQANPTETTSQKEVEHPNVLLIYMDDLRPELDSYGVSKIHSPHITELAATGMQFNEAYANVAVCGASRASMLTGIRPTKKIYLNYNTFVEKERPDAVTLPRLFKNNGYATISNGKIFHHLDDKTEDWDEVWRPYAFDKNDTGLAPTDYWQSLWKDYQRPENAKVYKETGNGPAYEMAEVNDSVYIDGRMAQKVIRDIKKLKHTNKPFFLTAGFISNHLPFNAPKKYWDLYPDDSIQQPYNNYVAKNAPKISISSWPEMRAYNNIPKKGPVTDTQAKNLIHAYYATVSYVDALIGQIMTALKQEGLYDNTIIVFVSDHGYNLEEHTQWAKFTSHRISSRVPLIISTPNMRKGSASNALIELVDVYPTLAELCHLQTPKHQLEGKSFVLNLKDVKLEGDKHIFMKSGNGFTIKTSKYGYTEYISPKNDSTIARMLYNHLKDPDENVNVVNLPEYSQIVNELSTILHTEYKSNILGEAPQ